MRWTYFLFYLFSFLYFSFIFLLHFIKIIYLEKKAREEKGDENDRVVDASLTRISLVESFFDVDLRARSSYIRNNERDIYVYVSLLRRSFDFFELAKSIDRSIYRSSLVVRFFAAGISNFYVSLYTLSIIFLLLVVSRICNNSQARNVECKVRG